MSVSETKAKALAVAAAILDKKATDVLILHIAKLTSIADYLVIGSGESERQARAIADHVGDVLKARFIVVAGGILHARPASVISPPCSC